MGYNPAELHMAIIYKNFDAVVLIVNSGGKLDSLWRGSSPVSCAVYVKAYKILEYLVRQGANVNIRTQDYKMEPPLFAACRMGNFDVVRILLNSKCLDVDQKDFFNRTPLWAAVRYSSAEMVELLLDMGADVNAAQDHIECPLTQALLIHHRDRRAKIIHLLITRGCKVDVKSRHQTPLSYAVRVGDWDLFRLLIRAGCSIKTEVCLQKDKLPKSWRENEKYSQWIHSLQHDPPSLLHLSTCFIRRTLAASQRNVFPSHIQSLPIPKLLMKVLLLED